MGDRPNPEGFDEALRWICAERCAEFGEPPCWRVPDLVKPCEEQITPCAECLADREWGEWDGSGQCPRCQGDLCDPEGGCIHED